MQFSSPPNPQPPHPLFSMRPKVIKYLLKESLQPRKSYLIADLSYPRVIFLMSHRFQYHEISLSISYHGIADVRIQITYNFLVEVFGYLRKDIDRLHQLVGVDFGSRLLLLLTYEHNGNCVLGSVQTNLTQRNIQAPSPQLIFWKDHNYYWASYMTGFIFSTLFSF